MPATGSSSSSICRMSSCVQSATRLCSASAPWRVLQTTSARNALVRLGVPCVQMVRMQAKMPNLFARNGIHRASLRWTSEQIACGWRATASRAVVPAAGGGGQRRRRSSAPSKRWRWKAQRGGRGAPAPSPCHAGAAAGLGVHWAPLRGPHTLLCRMSPIAEQMTFC